MPDEHGDPYRGEKIDDLRHRHAAWLEDQQEELRKAKKEDDLEDDWFEDRAEGYPRDLLPPDFDEFVPPEIRQRFVAAQREALIGVRALIDYWLDRSGDITAARRRPRQWSHHTPHKTVK